MADQPRLYVDPDAATLRAGVTLPMREAQAHYLGTVLRRAAGDGVRLFNPRDGEWQAEIAGLQRRGQGGFAITTRLRPPAPEAGPLLLFAPVKRDATDLVVRMATELGVSGLRPVVTARTNAARVNLERLQAIATEAAEQCERLSVPTIDAACRLDAMLSEWPQATGLAAAVERMPAERMAAEMGAPGRPLPDALLIGPEGGFAPPELDALRGRPFVTLISLGPRILRAETAAVAGLVCLQSARERWGLAPDGRASR